nr:EAL domain-containing protein [Neobacillus sp. Marseille-Q6967]
MAILKIAKDTTSQFFRKGFIPKKEIKNSVAFEGTSFLSLIENHPDTIFAMDIKGNILSCNSNIKTVLGYTSSEIHGPFQKVIKEENLKKVLKHFKQAVAGKIQKYTCIAVHKDGHFVDLQVTNIPMFSNEEVVGVYGIAKDITELNYLAYYDYLTGLPNRRKFEGEMEKLITAKQAKDEKFALIYLDLDRFKFVNDTLGHSVGDDLLKKVSKRLTQHLRTDDHLARLGGDEFAIILNNLSDPTETINIASQIMNDISRQFTVNDYQLHITTSIGIGFFPQDGRTANKLLANTDVALYRAKGAGKNNYQLYSPSMNMESFKLFALENDLRTAIQEEQFILHYQPRVDPKTWEIVGAEALIRWRHPDWGILYPNDFIPLAEETNLIIELGDWVIAEVCNQIRQWKEEGKKVVPVSVNVSAKRFLKDDLVTKLLTILKETDVEPQWLEFEITESSIIQNEEMSLSAIKVFKDLGIAISLDDFGTGFSSISYLKKFKVNYLKIDRSFIKGIRSCPDDEAIVKSLLYLARDLNMKVVAEGVETEEQLAFLLKHQCDFIQGYLFSKPVDVEVFNHLISKERILIQDGLGKKEELVISESTRIDLPAPIYSKMDISEMNGTSINIKDSEVIIENIGLGGLRFSTVHPLPAIKKLKLRIETEMLTRPLHVEGSILWIDQLDNNRYQYGFEFNLTEKEKNWLSLELDYLKITL